MGDFLTGDLSRSLNEKLGTCSDRWVLLSGYTKDEDVNGFRESVLR
jgi:hypothetical protein